MDRPVTLDSERLSANVSATLFTDTDVTLSGDYYVYQQNPAQVGFFTLVAAGRGAGVPIAPLGTRSAGGGPPLRRSLGAPLGPGRRICAGNRAEHRWSGSGAAVQVHKGVP